MYELRPPGSALKIPKVWKVDTRTRGLPDETALQCNTGVLHVCQDGIL